MHLEHVNNIIANDIMINITESPTEYTFEQLLIIRGCILKGLIKNKDKIIKEIKKC